MKGRRIIAHWIGMLAMLLCGALHAQQQGTVTYVYTDPQGTPLAEADAHGNITATFDYTPYGNQAMGTPPNGPGYTGHVNDRDTGLVYTQARYYDPAVGRFLSADPMVPSPGNTFNFNRYDYASNNPIINIDPDGRQSTMGAGIWAGEAVMANQSPKQVKRLNEINVAQAKLTAKGMATTAGGEAVGVVKAVVAIYKTLSDSSSSASASPKIDPKNVAGKSPAEIDAHAQGQGLVPKGPNPAAGKGSYVDPVTGKQRVLVHSNAEPPHAHVNNPAGERLNMSGKVVPPETPEAHLPIKTLDTQ